MSIDLKNKIEEYLALKPYRFRVLQPATLAQAVDEASGAMQQHLSLVLASDDGFNGDSLYLELADVRNLKLQQPGWSLITLSNLVIREASPPGRYDRKYVVLDAEEDIISRSCDDFAAAVG